MNDNPIRQEEIRNKRHLARRHIHRYYTVKGISNMNYYEIIQLENWLTELFQRA